MSNQLLIYYLLFLFIFSCQKKEKSDILESFKLKNEYLGYPNTRITDQYTRAHSEQKKLIRNHSRNLDIEFLGPENIAGRILCLAINPKDTNILWAGSASAGLWKSVTGGRGPNAWINIKIGLPVISISSIAIDPNNPEIMYAGTGESYSYADSDGGKHNRLFRGFWGIGILKSVDGGTTWSYTLDWSQHSYRTFWKIIVNPENSETIYASGTHGIYKSNDAGNSWFKILNKKMVNDLVMHPNIPSILIAGIGGIGGDDYGIFITKDAGDNWTKITDGDIPNAKGRIMLTINKNFPQKVFAILSDSLKTIKIVRTNSLFTNFAVNPTTNLSSYQGWYSKGLISNADGKELMVGGVDLFVDRSGNYNNFERYAMGDIKLHADFHDIISNPLDDSKLYYATDGGVYRTDNFGKTFYSCNSGLITTQFYSGTFSKNGKFGIGGMQDNRSGIYNGDKNWKFTHYGDGVGSAFTTMDLIYCCSQNLLISKSIDKGENWTTLLNDENSCFVSPFKMSPSDDKVLYAGSKILYKSTDQGTTFKKIFSTIDSCMINTIEISSTDPNFVLLSTMPNNDKNPQLLKSINGGKTFITITSNLPNRIISDINIITLSEYVVSISGFGTEHIFRTTDAGNTWRPISTSLPDLPIHTIWTSPFHPNLTFAGSDLGLYYTNNSGNTWTLYPLSSYDLVPVYEFSYISSEFKLVVFTHGRGVYRIDPFEIITVVDNTSDNKFNGTYTNNSIPTEFFALTGQLLNLNGQVIPVNTGNLMNTLDLAPKGIYYFISKNKKIKILNIY